MKALSLALLSIVIGFVSCSDQKGYTLAGTIDDAPDAYIYLSVNVMGEVQKLDSCLIINGDFDFDNGRVDYPRLCNLSIEGIGGNISFFIENSDIDISGHIDSLYKVEVEGSVYNDKYLEYIEEIEPYYKRNSILFENYRMARDEGNFELADSLNKVRKDLFNELSRLQISFIDSNPDSWLSPNILNSIAYSLSEDELRDALDSLDKSLEISDEVINLRNRLEALKNIRIGEIAPDFTQSTPEGNAVALSDIEGYKYLLIDFWAGWCGPCRKENPGLKKAYNKYKNYGFEILGVSLDNNKDEWINAIREDKLDWIQISDLKHWNNEAARLYCISNIPNNFLIDKNGIIIAKGLSADELLVSLDKLFESN